MFENNGDSADCIQLSSIMGSSLLSAWEAGQAQPAYHVILTVIDCS